MIGDYRVILMDYDGNIIDEYNAHIIPAVNDTILLDEEKVFVVQARHFSINHYKVVLLGELEKEENETSVVKD
jgi:hypothetical protein